MENLESVPAGTSEVSPAISVSSAITVEDALSQWQALFPGQDYVVWEKDAPWDHLDRVTAPPAGATELQNISLEIGRNEYESTSFVITSLVDVGGGSTVFDLSYVPIAISTTLRKGIWVTSLDGTEINDALSLIDGNRVSIAPGESLEIWVTLHGNDAAAGQYSQTVDILPQGLAPGSVDLSVTVHDVSLPEVLPLNTFYWDYVVPGWSTSALNAAKLADLKSHYVNTATVHPYLVPRYGFDNVSGALIADYALFDDAIDTYEAGLAPETYVFEMLTDIYFEPTGLIDYPTASRPTFLSTAWKDGFQQWLTGWVAHMQTLGMGYDDYVLHPYDERLDASVYEVAKLIKETDPQIRVLSNTLGTVQEISNIAPYVDVWTPLLNSWLAIGGVTGAMSQTVSLSPNTQYTFSFYGKNGTSTIYWDMNFDGSTSRRAEILGATDWAQDTHSFTTASDTTRVTFNFYPTVGNGSIFIDDVVLVGPGPNLVINGGIEQGTASPPFGWSTSSATAVVHTTDPNSGSQSAQVTSIPQGTNPGKDAILALVFPNSGTGTNLFTNGDMEGGGSPPAPWSANGTNGGVDGSVTTSTDTPSGSGQSIQVIDFDGSLTTYGLDYTAQGGYPDGDYVLEYDYKGGFYGGLSVQTATFPGNLAPGFGSTEWFSVADWTHYQKTIRVENGGVDGFSFTIWNNHDQGTPALIDNITLIPASQPEPPSQSNSLWTYANPQGALPTHADPYQYYRSAIWQAWNEGMTGFGYWIYSYRDAWNYFGVPGVEEGGYAVVYNATRPDTPPEVSSQELIVPSKRWEATREGVEDYAYLSMLRSAIDNSSLPPSSSLILDAENTLASWVQTVVDNQDTDFAAQAKPDIIEAIIALTPILTALSEVDIGEVGQIPNLTHVVQTIQLNRDYENPVVFAQSASTNGLQPVAVRVNDVQSDQFDIFLTEPSDQNGLHGVGETVTYVVLEAGSHLLADGSRLEVGTVDTAATVGSSIVNQWESVSFATSFDATPVVLSQIQTKSASGEDFLNTRHLSASPTNATLALEQEEAVTTTHSSETVGYLAIDGGVGTWNDMAYDARTTLVNITQDFTPVTYANTFATTPSLLSSLTSYFGTDNAHLRYTNPSASGVELKVGEDTTADTELNHTFEQASYLAIGGQGMLTALEPQFSIGEVGTVTNLTGTSRVIVLDRAYENPVVFAQSVSTEGQSPVVVRVTNIQSDRFTMYLAETSTDDGTHKAETVSYIVLEAGVHQLADGTRLEVGTTQTAATVGRLITNQWEQIDFSSEFAEAPVVLTQIQTTNVGSQNYLKTRQNDTDADGFSVGLEPEEIVDFQLGAAETIGYLAIEEGSGQWGALTYDAGNTAQTVTHEFSNYYSFGQFFQTPPVFLSSMGSYGGQDNAGIRYTNLGGSSVQLKVDEDTTADTEIIHSAEFVSYLAIGGQGALTASLPLLDVGEVGQIADLTNTLQIVTLHGQYDNPVVFAQSASANRGQPVTVRVRNVQSNRFEIFLAEPTNEDGIHGAETVTYLVLEAGVHTLHDGTRVEVGTVTTDATVHRNLTNEWETVTFSSSFDQTPVVLSQIQTLSAGGANYLNIRKNTVSPASVDLALEQDEASGSPHVAETIGFMAIEEGKGYWSGLAYETTTTANEVRDDWYDLAFDSFFNDGPGLLSSLATYDGIDNANVRYTNLTTGGVQLKVSEDDSVDTELMHSTESISYLAIGGSGLLTAVDPQIPPQVTVFQRDGGYDAYDVLGTAQYMFDKDVTVSADALQLTNDSVGGGHVDLTGIGFSYDAGSLTATWDFSSLPPLPAVWYTATLDAAKVTDASGLKLDGNGDGAAGDPYAHSFLVALRGDSDLDGYINITDFNTLVQNFDPLGLNGSNDWSRADFDGDGDVDITDFNALLGNFSPLGYAPLSSIQASSLTTGAATAAVIDTWDSVGFSVSGAMSDASASSETGLLDRAFADWDETTGDLVMPFEFFSRRRLRSVVH